MSSLSFAIRDNFLHPKVIRFTDKLSFCSCKIIVIENCVFVAKEKEKTHYRLIHYLNKVLLHLHLAGENFIVRFFHGIQPVHQLTTLLCLGSKLLAENSDNIVLQGRACIDACHDHRRWSLCYLGPLRFSDCFPLMLPLLLADQELLVWMVTLLYTGFGLRTLYFSRLSQTKSND